MKREEIFTKGVFKALPNMYSLHLAANYFDKKLHHVFDRVLNTILHMQRYIAIFEKQLRCLTESWMHVEVPELYYTKYNLLG